MTVTFRTDAGVTTVELVTPRGSRIVGRLDGARVVDVALVVPGVPGARPLGHGDLASLWHRVRSL